MLSDLPLQIKCIQQGGLPFLERRSVHNIVLLNDLVARSSKVKAEPKVGVVDWRERRPPEAVRGISSDLLFRSENLLVAVVRVDPGASVPIHRHEHSDEIFDVLEGHGEFLRDGAWEEIVPGMTVL